MEVYGVHHLSGYKHSLKYLLLCSLFISVIYLCYTACGELTNTFYFISIVQFEVLCSDCHWDKIWGIL